MHVREIKELIKAITESDITEFTMEDESAGLKLVLRKNVAPVGVAAPSPVTADSVQAPVAVSPPPTTDGDIEENVDPFDDPRYVTVTAPMVGTFYRAPAPDAEPYVKVGDEVVTGQALCIIEAMKLMNEIESEIKGRIVKILAENAEPVEYAQPLFVVEKE